MKKKKKVSKQKHKNRAPTLTDMVAAAHAVGMTVEVALVPKGPPEPPKHDVPEADWPGDPSCRSIIAHYASDAEIAQVFRDNPSSQWVITPHVIEEREAFMQRRSANPKPQTAKTP